MKKSTIKKLLLIMSVVLVVSALFCFGASAAADDDHTCVFTNYVYNNNATCTQSGTKTAYCDICNLKYDTIADPDHPATGHSESVLPAVEATCYSTGLTAGKQCSVCSVITVPQTTVEKKAHTYSSTYFTVVSPTCTSTGAQARKCTVCGAFELDNQEIIPMTAHNYVWTVTKTETCAADGSKKGVCSVCGDTITEVIPAYDHTLGEWYETKKATCTENGEEEAVCTLCNAHKTRETEKAPHTWKVMPAVEATCTTSGKTEGSVCYFCHELQTAQEYIAPIGHDLYIVDDVKAATCTDKGSGHYYCNRCDYSQWTEIPTIPHEDLDGDNMCDLCGCDMKVETCGCFCHYDTFIAKIVRVLNTLLSKLFNKDFRCCDDMEPLNSLFG